MYPVSQMYSLQCDETFTHGMYVDTGIADPAPVAYWVSLAEYRLFYRALLQKGPIILGWTQCSTLAHTRPQI